MAFLTKSAFAKLANVSRQRIYKMCEIGHLTVRPDGKLDTVDQTNENYLEKTDRRDGRKERDKEKEKPKQKSKKKSTKPKKQEEKIIDNNRISNLSDFFSNQIDLNGSLSDIKKIDLDKMKTAVTIEKDQIKRDKDRGQLIDRDLIKEFFGKLYSIDVNEFLQLSAALSSRICEGIFKTDDPEKLMEVSKLIDSELYKTQSHIQKKVDDLISDLTDEDETKTA